MKGCCSTCSVPVLTLCLFHSQTKPASKYDDSEGCPRQNPVKKSQKNGPQAHEALHSFGITYLLELLEFQHQKVRRRISFGYFVLAKKKKIHCVPCSSFVPSEILKDLLVGKTFLKCKSAAHQSLPIQPSSLNVNPLQDPKRLGKKHRKGLCTQKLCCANKEIQKIRHRSLMPLNLRASKGGRKVVLWKGKHCATFVQHWREMSQ